MLLLSSLQAKSVSDWLTVRRQADGRDGSVAGGRCPAAAAVREWVLSLPFALRYLLATRPELVTQVLGIVYRAISGHLIRKAGLTRASAVTGAVTLIQRFGSALNLNVHFHLLVLDGVYRREGEGRLRFVPVPAHGSASGPRRARSLFMA